MKDVVKASRNITVEIASSTSSISTRGDTLVDTDYHDHDHEAVYFVRKGGIEIQSNAEEEDTRKDKVMKDASNTAEGKSSAPKITDADTVSKVSEVPEGEKSRDETKNKDETEATALERNHGIPNQEKNIKRRKSSSNNTKGTKIAICIFPQPICPRCWTRTFRNDHYRKAHNECTVYNRRSRDGIPARQGTKSNSTCSAVVRMAQCRKEYQ